MPKSLKSPSPTYYRIRLKGQLEGKWSDWLNRTVISFSGDETILTGEVPDQAALHGLLARIRDLKLKLLPLECTEPEAMCDE